MVKSLILIAVFMGLLPFLLGLLYTGFIEEEKNHILLQMAAGYILMFGIFELTALPLVFMRRSLTLLTGVYMGVLGVAAVVSLILNGKRIILVIKDAIGEVQKFTICIWAVLLLLIGQIAVYIRYQYANADDAFYVASATTSVATNTIFAYNPYTGTAYAKLPSRYLLSPFHAWNAVLSRITDTHPAIMAHMVFMIVFLVLSYAVYALIGRALFSHNIEKTGYFLTVLAGLHVFAAYSERTSGLFLLIRLWQGKAVLAGILLPLILYLAIRIFLLEGKWADWVLLFLLMCACCMVSSMGIMLGAIMLGLLGILFSVKNRSFRILVYTGLCCLPNLICAGMYLMIR